MAISPVSSGYNGFGASAGSALSVTLPSTWAAGQFALLVVMCKSSTTTAAANSDKVTPPTGWTTIYQAEGMWLGYRFLQTGDTTWSVTNANSVAMAGEVTTFTGVDTTNPVDVIAFAHIRAQGPQGYAGGQCPPVNPGYANDYLVHVAGCNTASGSLTAPSGWTGLGNEVASGAGVRFSGLQATSAAYTAQVTATTAVMTSYGFAVSGMVALKASGASSVTRQPSFPYLASTIESFAAQASTTVPIVADFHDVPVAGDLMIAHIILGNSASATVTPPSGWNQITIDAHSLLYWRNMQSGDPATFNFAVSVATIAVCQTHVVKPRGTGQVSIYTEGFNSAAASSTTPTTPALTPSSTTDLLITRIDNDGTGSSTMTYHPSGSNIEDTVVYYGPNMSLGHLHLTPSPTPTAYATKSTAGSGTDKAFAMTVKFAAAAAATKQAQQMILS